LDHECFKKYVLTHLTDVMDIDELIKTQVHWQTQESLNFPK
jgi:hypothetical protein